MRADSNIDGVINITDAIFILFFLFQGGAVDCLVALDANDDGGLDLADTLYTLAYLFQGGPLPPFPFPACDNADTAPLGCESFPLCP